MFWWKAWVLERDTCPTLFGELSQSIRGGPVLGTLHFLQPLDTLQVFFFFFSSALVFELSLALDRQAFYHLR
jgi:hypothetical protein